MTFIPVSNIIKIILFGGDATKTDQIAVGKGVGKSSLVKRFTEDLFSANHDVTIGVEYGAREIRSTIPNQQQPKSSANNNNNTPMYKFQCWDTCGSTVRFESITTSYIRGCAFVLVCFDVSSRTGFEEGVPHYLNLLKSQGYDYTKSEIYAVLVATKVDLRDKKSKKNDDDSDDDGDAKQTSFVSRKEAVDFAEENDLMYFETSSKTGKGIDEMFVKLANHFAAYGPPKGRGYLSPVPPKKPKKINADDDDDDGIDCDNDMIHMKPKEKTKPKGSFFPSMKDIFSGRKVEVAKAKVKRTNQNQYTSIV